jgi:DNA-directed RNA polymerase specialized sigma24 family protein
MTSLPNPPAPANEEDYDEFVDLHAEQFTRYLRRLLDRSAEGRGGRVGVEDTLQEALVSIYRRWPELERLEDAERDRRLYRCLRSAAVDALRREYGARERSAPRPQLIAYDFASLDTHDDDRPVRERELTAAVLGGMARDVAEGDASGVVLGRAVLMAGLRALSEHEAVVVIAIDHLDWDQQRLAEHLGVGYSTLRETLYVARKLLSMTIRHAAGVEVSEEEQAQLSALRAGELKGAERRLVARHLGHCPDCQALDAQRRAFGHGAAQLLAPLPFVTGAGALAKRSVVKTAPAPAASGLFAQPGAAKVTAAVMGLLVSGGLASAILAARAEHQGHHHARPSVTATVGFPPPGGMRRIEPPAAARAAHHHKRTKHTNTKHRHTVSTQHPTPTAPPQQTTTPQQTPTTPPTRSTPPRSSSGADCEFFCG